MHQENHTTIKARSIVVALMVVGLLTGTAYAQTPATPAPAAAPEKPAEPAAAPPIFSIGGFDLTGHLDVGYQSINGAGSGRVFDFKRNQVILHSLDLQLAKTPEVGFGGVVDLTLGKDADTIAAYGTIDKNRGPQAGVNKRADVTQAYVHFGAAPLTVIAGKYVTLAGAEVIKSAADTNYSRSILFGFAIPFTHTGVRATYKMSDELSLIAGVNQGWDAFEDPNHDKTIELGVTYAPSKTVALTASIYTGKENISNYPVVSSEKGNRSLIDLVGTFSLTEQLTFILNFDYGEQKNATLVSGAKGTAKWDGLAAYLNYQFNDNWRTSLRAEYFHDRDGYRTGLDQTAKEVTATVAWLPTKEVEVRLEGRVDRSDKDAYLNKDRSGYKKSQSSVGVELLYKF